MKTSLSAALAFAAAMASASCAVADSNALSCPASIKAGGAPAGWIVVGDPPATEKALTVAGFSDGDPKDKAILAPSSEEQRNGATVDTYDVSALVKGLWLVCNYADTDALLAHKVENAPKTCAAPREAKPDAAATCE